MKAVETLRSVGLSKWESRTYLALLELGETKTGGLVKKSEVPQSKIYGVLDSLMKKGFVSYTVKGKIKFFHASSPERLMVVFRERQNELNDVLSRIVVKKNQGQSVEIFEGIKAIRFMLLSLVADVKKGEDFYGFSTGQSSKDKKVRKFYDWWGDRKKSLGLNDHLMISSANRGKFESTISENDIKYVRKKTRYSEISFPGDVAIFREFVILFNYEFVPTAILIKSSSISQQYRDFFLGIWNKSI